MAFSGVLSIAVAGGGLLLGACGSDGPATAPSPPGSKDTIDYVFGEKTKQLTEADLAALQDGADTSQTLRFDVSAGAKFARGDVLIVGQSPKTPRGLLRIVTNAATVGNVVELETDQAPLQLAFQRLKLHVERVLDMPVQTPAPLSPLIDFPIGGQVRKNEFIFNGDKDPKTLEDQLHIDDSFEGQIGVTLDIDFDWGFADTVTQGVDHFLECSFTFGLASGCNLHLPKLTATFDAEVMLATSFDHEGAASAGFKTGKFELGKPVTVTPGIPVGPLYIIPQVGFRGEMEGRAGSYSRLVGNSQAGMGVKIKASSNAEFDATPVLTPPVFHVTEVAAYLDGHVSTSVGPHIDMLLFGAIGPTFGLSLRSDLDVDRTRVADCYRASMALDAEFGFKIQLPWRALGEALSGSSSVGEDVEWVASKFGLDGVLLDIVEPKELFRDQVGQGVCTIPPPGMLPPGAPQDDTLANPPFTQWSRRYDEPGLHFDYSALPHQARTRLVPGIDGHLWAPSPPSPTLRRIAIDGRQLTAVRYLAPIPEEDNRELPLAVSHVIERADLVKWVLFENGTIGRLGAQNELIDAFSIVVPFADGEEMKLRRGAVRPDGRTALVYGVREISSSFDHRMVLVELDEQGLILRSRAFGAPTVSRDEVQREFFTNSEILYRTDGTLLLAGDYTADKDAHAVCTILSVADDGALAFANTLSPAHGTCTFGGLNVSDNTDILVTGNDGNTFENAGVTMVLDANGNPKTSATFQLGGDSLIQPLFISRVSTSGYLVAGSDVQSALQSGQFVVRLDAQGVPLSASSYRPPQGVQLGFLDAYVSKDAGVVLASLADWNDQAEQRDVTRFLTGKAFAKDGSLPFNAASGITTVSPGISGNVLTTFAGALPYTLVDVPVTITPTTPLRAEDVESPDTVFAP